MFEEHIYLFLKYSSVRFHRVKTGNGVIGLRRIADNPCMYEKIPKIAFIPSDGFGYGERTLNTLEFFEVHTTMDETTQKLLDTFK